MGLLKNPPKARFFFDNRFRTRVPIREMAFYIAPLLPQKEPGVGGNVTSWLLSFRGMMFKYKDNKCWPEEIPNLGAV